MTIDNEPNASTASAVDESSAASRQRRRKRKWDQPADSLVSSGIVVPGIFPLPHVLPAIGIAHPGTSTMLLNSIVPNNVAQPKLQDEVIAREIVINDAEASLRYKLTKRQTQDEIQKCTGAIVITRGKYRPSNAVPDGEKPLYLHISAGSHLKEMAEKIIAVDRAAAMVEEMLKQNNILQAASTTDASGNVVKGCQALNACVFLGFDADPSANVVSRIRGPNDQYINHIMNETGATVLLRGRGSGNVVGVYSEEEQPLHLFISSNNSKSLEDARLLAENLLDTISMEFGASRVSSLKVYNAVPQHLLPAAQSSSSGLQGNVTASTPNGTPFVGALSPALSFIPGIAAVGSNQVISQPGYIHNVHHSLGSGTSYNGYSGLYPQATPLQQVAFALKQPSITDTSVVGSSYSQNSNTDFRSIAQLEKNPPRRRKFQELPVAAKGSSQEHKELLRESVADASAKHISVMPAPKKLIQSSSNVMPPPPPRDMPPPPPKFTSSKPTSKVHEQNTVVLRSETVPDPLVKQNTVVLRSETVPGKSDFEMIQVVYIRLLILWSSLWSMEMMTTMTMRIQWRKSKSLLNLRLLNRFGPCDSNALNTAKMDYTLHHYDVKRNSCEGIIGKNISTVSVCVVNGHMNSFNVRGT